MKSNKFFAALVSIVLASANSVILAPLFSVSAEDENVSADTYAQGCTVNVSVVDITTGENLEGAIFEFEQNPTGSSIRFGEWNTSDEPVKTVEDLYSWENYSINAVSIPQGYIVPQNTFFSFDKDGEVKDFTIRVVPENVERNVYFTATDWTDAVPTEDGRWFVGTKEYKDYISAAVYDKNGKLFTRQPLGWGNCGMYLPDGKYSIRITPDDRYYETITEDIDIAKTAMEMYESIEFPNKDGFFDIEIVNGILSENIDVYIRMKPEVVEYIKDGCKANVSVVDLYTNEPVDDVKLRLIDDPFSEREVIAEWYTTNEPIKNIKNLLPHRWYHVEVVAAPDGYFINKSTSFDFSDLGDTQNIVIKAVPNNEEPNVNVTVYDWTDLVVNPFDGTYEGSKLMDPDDYTLMVYDHNFNRFEVTEGNVHLPDGEYSVHVFYKESEYQYVDNQGWKARAVRRILGKDFIIPESFTTSFEIRDGKTVGQPCLFVEKLGSSITNCTLNLQIIDGVTGKPAEAADYRVIRIDEEFEEQVEKFGLVEDTRGFMPAYGNMPESGTVTVEELEPFIKYIIVGSSGSKKYSGEKTALITYDKDGETKDVTIKLMPFDYIKGDVNGDGELGVADLVMLQKWLLNAPDTTMAKAGNADFNEDGTADVFDLVLLRKELIDNIQ
ncbi:dockerin type I repeat-containing protein [Ruminococcus sp.]|uniref:dockerin type I repeat-containing protein n=1 Tax=Ruminococcus sp. TaxID=41978 RepID=UPI0025E3CAAC|nr:dockerin type I repeat-containing protein [Ruminococcus sp.]